jgi:CHAT domain-containing protein
MIAAPENSTIIFLTGMMAFMGKKDTENKKQFTLLQLIADSLKRRCGRSLANHSLLAGMHYNRTGNPDKALSYLYEGLSFERRAKHPDKALESIAINFIYEILLSQDRFEEALASVMTDADYEGSYDKSLFVAHIRHHSVFPFHFLINLIDIYFAKYKKNKNPSDLKEARELVHIVNDEIYQQYDVTDEDAIIKFFDDEVERYFDLALNVLFELYLNTGKNHYLEEFVLLSDRHSNVTLERDMKLKSGSFNLPDSVQQMELELIEAVKNYKRYGKSSLLYADAPLRYAAFQANLKKEYPEYFDQALVKSTIDLPNIYENLKKVNGAVVKTDILGDKMFVTIINESGINVYPVNFQQEHSDKLREFAEILSQNLDVSVKEYQDRAFEIYQWMFGAQHSETLGKKVFFIPAGLFYNINPEALVTAINPNATSFTELQYWIKTTEIVLTPGVSFMKKGRTDDIYSQRNPEITAFSFSGEKENQARFGIMSGLRGTYLEVRDIKKIFPDAKIFTGKNATLTAFKHLQSSAPPDILHLGLHGFSESAVRDEVKLYFRKGDGIDSLVGYELLNLNISARLLVLSACQSAAGKIHAGEGIYSLARYFMINQVNHIIASAWNLDDQFSAHIFSKYYSHSNANSISNGSALTEVKRSLIKKSVHPHFIFGLVRYSLEF